MIECTLEEVEKWRFGQVKNDWAAGERWTGRCIIVGESERGGGLSDWQGFKPIPPPALTPVSKNTDLNKY